MDKKMFCYQCEQTVGCTGCTGNAGVCGKKAGTAKLQDELTGALIGLARAVDGAATISKSTSQVIIEGLFTTVTNVSFDDAAIENMIQKVRAEKERLVPGCSKCQSPCGKSDEYDMQQLWNADEDIRSLKSLILFGIRGMAAYAYHANVLNYEDAEVNQFFCEALSKIFQVMSGHDNKRPFFYRKCNISWLWCSIGFCICLIKKCHALQIDFSYFENCRKQCFCTLFIADLK